MWELGSGQESFKKIFWEPFYEKSGTFDCENIVQDWEYEFSYCKYFFSYSETLHAYLNCVCVFIFLLVIVKDLRSWKGICIPYCEEFFNNWYQSEAIFVTMMLIEVKEDGEEKRNQDED